MRRDSGGRATTMFRFRKRHSSHRASGVGCLAFLGCVHAGSHVQLKRHNHGRSVVPSPQVGSGRRQSLHQGRWTVYGTRRVPTPCVILEVPYLSISSNPRGRPCVNPSLTFPTFPAYMRSLSQRERADGNAEGETHPSTRRPFFFLSLSLPHRVARSQGYLSLGEPSSLFSEHLGHNVGIRTKLFFFLNALQTLRLHLKLVL
ncbi:hypothetical protein VTK73DRAFT_2241 [Phialemonium thermophilum]|uniref:Uncharacterized protein n=1 Tax=Phialemonium thermophilum TaxID=223376 RepID=A0ABR3VSG0_9PEZI